MGRLGRCAFNVVGGADNNRCQDPFFRPSHHHYQHHRCRAIPTLARSWVLGLGAQVFLVIYDVVAIIRSLIDNIFGFFLVRFSVLLINQRFWFFVWLRTVRIVVSLFPHPISAFAILTSRAPRRRPRPASSCSSLSSSRSSRSSSNPSSTNVPTPTTRNALSLPLALALHLALDFHHHPSS